LILSLSLSSLRSSAVIFWRFGKRWRHRLRQLVLSHSIRFLFPFFFQMICVMVVVVIDARRRSFLYIHAWMDRYKDHLERVVVVVVVIFGGEGKKIAI
jgi:hypothetical protein